MANIFLTLDLKKNVLYDDEDKFYYDFDHWNYSVKSREFELDGMNINYDLIDKFIFERDIKSDKAYVELEEGYVSDVDTYDSELNKYLGTDLAMAVEKFVADKDLEDGEYKVKYNYYFDFSEDEFVCEIEEVIADE